MHKVSPDDGDDQQMQNTLLNFRELLSWKMPEHFCSTSNANNK